MSPFTTFPLFKFKIISFSFETLVTISSFPLIVNIGLSLIFFSNLFVPSESPIFLSFTAAIASSNVFLPVPPTSLFSTEISPLSDNLNELPRTFCVLLAKVLNTLFVAYNCEPFIASVELSDIAPGATLTNVLSLSLSPILTTPTDFPANSPYFIPLILTAASVVASLVTAPLPKATELALFTFTLFPMPIEFAIFCAILPSFPISIELFA